MAFFGEEPAVPLAPFLQSPEWMAPPAGELGGFVPARVELARSSDHLVMLGPLHAHPSGVEIDIEVRSRVESFALSGMFRPSPGGGGLRYGVRFPDASSTATSSSHFAAPGEEAPKGPVLVPRGGGGGGGRIRQALWLWPLTPDGDVEFFMRWDHGGFEERSVTLDGTAIREAANRAETLWPPLTAEEQEAFQREAIAQMTRLSAASQTVTFAVGDAASSTRDEAAEVDSEEQP